MARKPKRREEPSHVETTPSRRPLAWLICLGGAALAIRVICVFELRGSPFISVLIGDSLQYDTWARQIASEDWLGREVFYQSPLYPYLLAVLYSTGLDTFSVRLLQAALGAASCVILAMAGQRFFDPRAGLVAGALLAIYPPAIFHDMQIQKSSLDVFLISLLLLALSACLAQPKRAWLVAAGLTLGALALNRENTRVLIPAVAAWLFFRTAHGRWQKRASHAAVLMCGIALVLGPVALRNRYVGGEWLLSTSQSGPNFYIGNHRGANGGYTPLVPGRGNAAFEREDATRLAESASGRTLSAAGVSEYWWRRSFEEIREAPAQWMRLLARKVRLTLSAGEPVDTESLEAYTRSAAILRILSWFDFGVVMALAWLGAWITRERWRTLSLLYLIFGLLAGSVVMFYVLARYRLPLAPTALLFSGAGIAAAATRARMPPKDWWVAGTGAVVLALVLHIPIRTSSDETYVNYGSELLRQGRPAEAVTLLREAVNEDPLHKDARLSLGLALQKSGDGDGAAEQFRAAIRIDPGSAEAQAGLAITLHQQGRTREAIPYYEEAVRLKPDSIEAMSNLALALNEAGRPLDALVPLERAVALQPGNVAVRMNLCQVIAATSRGSEAIRWFEQAAVVAKTPDEILQTQYALAQAQAASGQVADAVASLERAVTSARASGDLRAIVRIEEALRILRASR